jgi:hypothetical protein
MRKTLIAIGVIGIAYLLYKQYMKESNKKPIDPPQKSGDAIALAIKQAQMPKPEQPKNIIGENRLVFREMREGFNSDESATVAPSINAKIGIF